VAHELLLYNGRILAETHALPIGYVLLRDGRIASIGEAWEGLECWRREETEGIDAKGLLVCPGLIDMHTHGIKDVDFMSGDEESMSRALAAYAAFGVTRVVASTYSNPYDRIIAQAKRMKKVMEDRQYGDMLHGMHMEGPWLAPRCKGGHALEYLRLPERGEVERVLGEAGEVMRTVTYAPELPGSVWLTEQLALRGIVPVLGHTEASFEEAERAILAGARHVTHMYDGTLGYREDPEEALVMMPGMETAVLHSDEVSIELIGCPVHVPKPFFRFIDKVKPRGKKVIVTDCLKGTGLPEGSVLASADGRKAYVEAGVLRMISDDPKIHGNLTGSAVTLNVALGRLREYAGLAIEEAIRWVSLNPAMTLGIGGETGSLRVGKLGDVMVMDEGCGVKMTFVKGRKVFGVG
jgi:N-acetylglucosamine-6-phosphate deacetylase